MTIEVACQCGKRYQTADEHAGKETRCPACGRAAASSHLPDDPGLVPLEDDHRTFVEEAGLVPLNAGALILDEEAGLVPLDAGHKSRTPTAGMEEEDLVPLRADDEARVIPLWEEEPGPGEYEIAAASTGDKPNLASAVYGEIGCFKLRRRQESPSCVAFSADGKRAFAALGGTVFILDPRMERVVKEFKIHDAAIGCLAISPDGRQAITGAEDHGRLCLWSLKTGRAIARLNGHGATVGSVAFSPDGRLALSGGRGGDLFLWDATMGTELDRLEERLGDGVRTVCFSPDGLLSLAAGGDGQVRLWKVLGGRRLQRLEAATGEIAAAVFTNNGRRIVAAGDNAADLALAIWRWETAGGERVQGSGDPPQCEGRVTAVALTPGGHRILVASISEKPRSLSEIPGRIALLDPDTLVGWPGFAGGLLGAAAGAVAGAAIGIGIAGLLGGLLGLVTGTVFGFVAGFVLGGVLLNMPKASRSRRAEKCQHYLLELFEIADGSRVMTYEGHQGAIRCLAIAPNGLRALSGAEDGTVRVWGLPP